MKKILGLVLAVMMLLPILPAATVADTATVVEAAVRGDGQTGTIVNCKTKVNVREKASSKSTLLGTADKGNTYDVLGLFGNWVKIDFDGEEGYVYKKYIRVEGVPSDTPVSGKVGKIVNCKTKVNVREDATSKSKLLGTAKKGKTFKALAIEGNWVKIQYKSDTEGYVFKKYVKLYTPEEPIEGKTGTIKCNTHVNIRAKATKNSKLLGTATNGETFTVKGKSGNWIKIDFNGEIGYVYKKYIKIS